MSKWISTEERWPEDDDDYVVLIDTGVRLEKAVAYIDSEDCEMNWYLTIGHNIINGVVYWLEGSDIPEPPQHN